MKACKNYIFYNPGRTDTRAVLRSSICNNRILDSIRNPMMELNLSPVILLILVQMVVVSNLASGGLPELYCSENDDPYKLNSSFHSNLQTLFDSLSRNTPSSKNFYNTSVGNGMDLIYGRALCRGDVTPSVCQICVKNAGEEMINKCQKQDAAIWFEKCQVEYSFDMLPTAYTGKYPELDSEKASNPELFCDALKNLMDILSNKVAVSELMFASGNSKFLRNETLYGLLQCTRDISRQECGICLNKAFVELNGCQSSEGGAMLSRTCNVRFELYQFYNISQKNGHKGPILAGGAAAICAAFILAVAGFYTVRSKIRTKTQGDEENSQIPVLQQTVAPPTYLEMAEESKILTPQEWPFMEFAMVKAATDNFSESNKLGQGGFGTVYKGILTNGKEIAVKRLSRNSWQGSEEFKNEIELIVKLQHRNLVRLLGCGLEGNEKLLIYEYMPNKSLDILLFDQEKRAKLDWNKRINIINGIARGLLYLHEESRLKIVHRDVKPSNVLLDHEMSAKISDFGMARIFCENQDIANTNRVVGTYGYMAPEYAMDGVISTKSDVFSFGVMLLEIISGKKNKGFHLHAQTLPAFAWRLWNEGQELELVDTLLTESCRMQEVERCIHIGLLCVQEDPAARPIMSQVVVLLDNKLMELPQPKKPAFLLGRVVHQVAPSHPESSSVTDPSVNQVTVSSIAPR